MMDFRNNMQKCRDYVDSLEEEKKKIQVFQRELPLCLELVTQAIEACKQQLCGTTTSCLNGHSECSEQTSDCPVFEEFMPIKRSVSADHDNNDDEDLESNQPQNNLNNNDRSGNKSDWLRSVQLWNQTPDSLTIQEDNEPTKLAVELKSNDSGGAFHPFEKENNTNENAKINHSNDNNNNNKKKKIKEQLVSAPAASASSSAQDTDMGLNSGGSGGSGCKKSEKDGQSQRKSRRCWSAELHKRFVHALQQLGGSHIATPKQIREMMKVDGLTNDEVKSHLQKYRLHTRRPNSAVHNNTNQQTPQFVVVGGIWMPPPEYAAVAVATTASETATIAPASGIYAPIATMATPPRVHHTSPHMQPQKQSSQSHSEERASHSEGGVHFNSPATSSSTHTSTASHSH